MFSKIIMLENLRIIYNEIIPPDQSNGVPGAGDLIKEINILSDLCEELRTFLVKVVKTFEIYPDASYKKKKEIIISSLNLLRKENRRDYNAIVVTIIIFYYSNQEVLTRLGVQSVPPFPSGNTIDESDLTIFGDVFLGGKIYRE